MRASDLEDDLGMDLDEDEGSLDDSVEGERSLASDSLQLDDDSGDLQLPTNETASVNSDETMDEHSIQS